jgi:hypothetical protein
MNTSPRVQPRFVPTLTEVVDPQSLNRMATPKQPDAQAIVEMVLVQIRPIFERRLQEELDRLIRSMLTQQWTDVTQQLQDEMTLFVRQAVEDALRGQRSEK